MLALLPSAASAQQRTASERGAQRVAAAPAAARPAPARPAVAPDDPWTMCERAIAAAEPNSGLPAGLLTAISKVEAGRRHPSGRAVAWPWAINLAGTGAYADSRTEAIQTVQEAIARGIRSVDVGCMQINLQHHPNAFATLEEGFDPAINIRYAIGFLRQLGQRANGDWAQAVAWYHSGEPERGAAYQRRVMAVLGGAEALSTGPALLPLGTVANGLCANGRAPVLLLTGSQQPQLQPVIALPSVMLHLRPGARGPERPRVLCLNRTTGLRRPSAPG